MFSPIELMSTDDSRSFSRFPVRCRINCKLLDDDQAFDAVCSNLSGSGILFHTDHPVEIGKAIEIHVAPTTGLIPPFMAFVEIVRCSPMPRGQFFVAGSIKGIKSN